MIGTTELIVAGVIVFLLFGGAIFARLTKQVVHAKREATNAVKELTKDESTENKA